MKYLGFTLVIISTVCVISCGSPRTTGQESISIKPLESTTLVNDIGDYISELRIIPITGQYAANLFSPSKILVADGIYVVLSGNTPFALNKDGVVLGQYGRFGRGPGEYLMIRDFCISPSNEELWCLSSDNSILRYGLLSMSYLGKIETDNSFSASSIIPINDDIFALFVPNPRNADMSDFSKEFNCLKYYDISGHFQWEDFKRTDFNISAAFSVPTSHSGKTCYALSPGSLDMPTVFFDRGERNNIFFDFQEKALPYKYAFNGAGDPWEKVTEIFAEDYYKLVNSVCMIKDGLYFCAFGQRSSVWNFVLFKNSGIRWRSISFRSKPICALASDGDSLIYICDDLLNEDNRSYDDPIKKVVLDKFRDQITPDGQYLVLVTFHEK